MHLRLSLGLLCCLIITGCASPAPKANVPQAGRVVLIDALAPTLTNAHMGATVFGNYNEPIENDWDIPHYAESVATARLLKEGYVVVPVKPDPGRIETMRKGDHFSMGWSALSIKPTYATWFRDLMREHDASAVIVLRDFDLQFNPNTNTRYGGYGVASVMGFKPDEAILYAYVGADVLSGDPLARNPLASKLFECKEVFSTASLPVDNLKDLKATHLAAYRKQMETFVGERIEQDLAASGLVTGAVAPCEIIRH